MSHLRRKNPWRREYPRPVCWVALSPVYDVYEMSWDPPEPAEQGQDFLFVWALSAQRAKRLAIRAWRRGWWRGCTTRRTLTARAPYIVRYDDENPLAAITIERIRIAELPDAPPGAPRE